MARVQRKSPFILHLPKLAIAPGNSVGKEHSFWYSCLGGLEVFVLAAMITVTLTGKCNLLFETRIQKQKGIFRQRLSLYVISLLRAHVLDCFCLLYSFKFLLKLRGISVILKR